jgi:putative membrane protein
MIRKFQDYIFVVFKGMAMGAADVVPGVSGGTIAFITGIYTELIDSLKSFNSQALKLFASGKIKQFWAHINGWFLLSLGLGVALSIISLAKVLQELLEKSPEPLWSFFFGLIVASAIVVARKITTWDTVNIAAIILGTAAAYLITALAPASTPEAYWFIFICGAISICAMILPGISGSFILLMLGKYEYILSALTSLKLDVIAVFGAGAAVGLLSFSNVLSWLLHRFRNATTAVLAGFMIGSLNKVWPWKETVETFIDRHGAEKPYLQHNVLPGSYLEVSGNDPQLILACIMCAIGFSIIIVFEKVISEE